MLHQNLHQSTTAHIHTAPMIIEGVAEAIALLASVKRSLDDDPSLARRYLDKLSALLEGSEGEQGHDHILLPEHPEGFLPTAKGGLAGWQIRKVIEYIDARLGQQLFTEDLAEVTRLSTGHFCRAFKASVGETPHSYIIRRRLRHAQILMLETRDTLSQIACACGLTDQAHLTRLFRRNIGTTPMSWRRTWQNIH